MTGDRRSWDIGDKRQRSPESGEFETVDTVRSENGEFRSPSSLILESLSVGQATTATELSNTTGVSEATIIEHLARLEREQLVEEEGGGWSLAHDSERIDPTLESHRRKKEEAAEWEYEDDESLY